MSSDTQVYNARIKMVSKTLRMTGNIPVSSQWTKKIQGYRNSAVWLHTSAKSLLQDENAYSGIHDSLIESSFATYESEISLFVFEISDD